MCGALPGVQLMWDVMRHACESRMAGVELLGKVEDWLSIWARDVREYRTVIFYPFNLRGLGAVAADTAHALANRFQRRPGHSHRTSGSGL